MLVIGDLHLPYRASDLPSKFRKLLVPGKIQQIVCTGNVCDRETLDYLRTVAGDVHVVRGDWDDNVHFPSSLILHHPPLRIGVLHGHQIVPAGDTDSLCALARAMDVDVLLSGSTHKFDAFEREGRFFVNPGSATGAWSAIWPVRDPVDAEADDEDDEDKHEEADEGGEKEDAKAVMQGKGPERGSKEQKADGKRDEGEAESASTPGDDDKNKVINKESKDKQEVQDGKVEQVKKEEAEHKGSKGTIEPKLAPGPTPSFARKYKRPTYHE